MEELPTTLWMLEGQVITHNSKRVKTRQTFWVICCWRDLLPQCVAKVSSFATVGIANELLEHKTDDTKKAERMFCLLLVEMFAGE